MKKLPLNFVYLKYFFDSVRYESISDAAKVNFVSQSAVSQAIAKLEESLGFELISHKPNSFKLTEKGQQLFSSAREIFQAVQKAEDLLLKEDCGTITIGCTHSFSLTLLPIFLKESKRLYPSLKIRFRLGHFHAIREWLKKQTIDFAILINNEDLSQFDLEEIYEGEFRLYKAENV
ncbi:MAG TPA: LysR family transcriptional regulator, partial [Candidatus Babeliaceae bacterium]|nr:LysR family transcriptional regulator [Candidatus Babeliaceae bacterium]